jgi:hypothetical protein
MEALKAFTLAGVLMRQRDAREGATMQVRYQRCAGLDVHQQSVLVTVCWYMRICAVPRYHALRSAEVSAEARRA